MEGLEALGIQLYLASLEGEAAEVAHLLDLNAPVNRDGDVLRLNHKSRAGRRLQGERSRRRNGRPGRCSSSGGAGR